MSVFKNIKLAIAKNSLQKELKNVPVTRNAQMFSFANFRSVGILFDATNAEDFELVKRYVVYLREHRKKVKVLGYFSTKEIPALTYSKLEYDFFTSKELTWYGKPVAVAAQNFAAEEFDLLMDLNIHDHFPLHYLAAKSKAAFKVGKFKEEDTPVYDMMIDSDNTKTLKYFLRQVDIYISMLNKQEETIKD
jgi:hypothetical protein